jgi:hypothetical protein
MAEAAGAISTVSVATAAEAVVLPEERQWLGPEAAAVLDQPQDRRESLRPGGLVLLAGLIPETEVAAGARERLAEPAEPEVLATSSSTR